MSRLLAAFAFAALASCSGAPAPTGATDPGGSEDVSMTKAELCDRVGHRICKRCDPDGEAECVSGYQQTCGDDAKTTRVSPSGAELAACDKGIDAAECAGLIGGELPPACTSGSDW